MMTAASDQATRRIPTDRENLVTGAEHVDTSRESAGPKALTARDVMSTPVVTISAHKTLWDAWSLMYRVGLRRLVVLDGTRCVGVIDDRRLALEWPRGPSGELARKVRDVISGRVRCVLPDTPISELAGIMVRYHVEALPVVTPAGGVVGLVSASDLLLVLARHDDLVGPRSNPRSPDSGAAQTA